MSKTIAVKGGTLIDGTGRAPVKDALILIEGGRFKAVGTARDVKVPDGADVIDATGLTILPGFIDGHAHLEDFHGELYLHLGITTAVTIQIFQDGPWTSAQKRGTELGKIRGPRIWYSGRAIGGTRVMTDAPDGRTSRGNIVVATPEEARAAVRRKHKLGCDVIKLNEFLPLDLVKVVVEEAHGLGMAVTTHTMDAIGSAKAGVDAIEHIWSVGTSSILYAPSREQLHIDRLGGLIDQEIANSYYQTENFPAIIDAMVSNGVAWTPTIAKWLQAAVAQRRALPRTRGGDPRKSQGAVAGLGARRDAQRLRQAVQTLHARAARARQDRPRQGQRVHPPLRGSGRHAEGGLRPAARHGRAPHAPGAGDGRGGRRAADEGAAGSDLERRQDIQEGQGLRQHRSRQGRRPHDDRG